ERRRSAENEIDVSLDVTVFKYVTAAINKQCVLPAEEATALKRSAIRVYKQRHCLRTSAKRIFKRQVLSAKVVRIDERAERESRIARLLRADAKSENGLERIVAAQREVTLAGIHSYLFLINAGFDPNHDRLVVVIRNVVQCLLDRLEITGTIRGNNNLRVNITYKKAQKAQKNCQLPTANCRFEDRRRGAKLTIGNLQSEITKRQTWPRTECRAGCCAAWSPDRKMHLAPPLSQDSNPCPLR